MIKLVSPAVCSTGQGNAIKSVASLELRWEQLIGDHTPDSCPDLTSLQCLNCTLHQSRGHILWHELGWPRPSVWWSLQ